MGEIFDGDGSAFHFHPNVFIERPNNFAEKFFIENEALSVLSSVDLSQVKAQLIFVEFPDAALHIDTLRFWLERPLSHRSHGG